MSHFDKFQQLLTEIGIPFELTDDSEETNTYENIDTVIVIKQYNPNYKLNVEVYFFFRRDGSFKEWDLLK